MSHVLERKNVLDVDCQTREKVLVFRKDRLPQYFKIVPTRLRSYKVLRWKEIKIVKFIDVWISYNDDNDSDNKCALGN